MSREMMGTLKKSPFLATESKLVDDGTKSFKGRKST
jgi:hypothetical protein